jgi:uncharacterized protein (DUF2141 family)
VLQVSFVVLEKSEERHGTTRPVHACPAFLLRAAVVSLCGLLWTTIPAISEEAPVLDIRPDEAAAVCGAQPLQIEVTVTNTKAQGILAVELYEENEPDFLTSRARLHRIRVPAEEGQQTVCFDIPAPGVYAVATYHDLDADRHFDRRLFLPAEPFGLSNNPRLRLRKPRFEEAAFTVGEEGASVTIALRGVDD